MKLIDKDALVAEINRRKKELIELSNESNRFVNQWACGSLDNILSFLDTLEVDLKPKSFVKIDRKVLFEICDAILNHDGYSDVNDCLENDSECFWGKWDEGFRKKVENIRRNS